MVKKLFILSLLIGISFSFKQQEFSVALPNFKGCSLSQIKKNNVFTVLTEISGDLNNDSKLDVALVLETKDSIYEKREPFSDDEIKGKARILLVFLNKKGKQIVHTQNNKFIARSYEGGMSPYIEPKLSIEKNRLEIFQEYTRFYQTYTFQFKRNRFMIVNAENSGVNGASGDFTNTKYDFVHHKLVETTGNIGIDGEKVTISKFAIQPKALSDFNEMYEWEVLKDHFL